MRIRLQNHFFFGFLLADVDCVCKTRPCADINYHYITFFNAESLILSVFPSCFPAYRYFSHIDDTPFSCIIDDVALSLYDWKMDYLLRKEKLYRNTKTMLELLFHKSLADLYLAYSES